MAAAIAGNKVVNPEQRLKQARSGELAFEMRHDEAQGVNQPRCLRHQPFPLPHSIPGKTVMAATEVPKAAVDHLGGPAGGAPGEIFLFHQKGAQAAACCFPGHAGTGDAAADHHHIKFGCP